MKLSEAKSRIKREASEYIRESFPVEAETHVGRVIRFVLSPPYMEKILKEVFSLKEETDYSDSDVILYRGEVIRSLVDDIMYISRRRKLPFVTDLDLLPELPDCCKKLYHSREEAEEIVYDYREEIDEIIDETLEQVETDYPIYRDELYVTRTCMDTTITSIVMYSPLPVVEAVRYELYDEILSDMLY